MREAFNRPLLRNPVAPIEGVIGRTAGRPGLDNLEKWCPFQFSQWSNVGCHWIHSIRPE